MAAFRDELKAVLRQVTPGDDALPPGPFAGSRLPRRRLGGTLGRVLSRFRYPVAPRAAPAPAPAREWTPPAAWAQQARPSLAVLPFHNLAEDARAAFYSFALADGLITELAQVGQVVVRPSSYIARYAGREADPLQVGEELAVSYVLTGGFIRAPDRFRVNAQLLDARSGEIVWSEKLDFASPDLIAIQDRLAERVLGGLELGLTADQRASLGRRPTASVEAYEFYSRGRDLLYHYVLQTLDEPDLEEAIRMFHEAVGRDDRFALAHAALARAYVLHAQGYGGSDYYVLAERALRRALELEPDLVEARLQQVYVDLHHGNKDRAHQTIEALRAQVPDDPSVLFVAAMLYRLDGLYEEALEAYDRLLAINPSDVVVVSFNRARIYTHQQQYEAAIAELERAGEREPEHPLVKTFLAIARFNQGHVEHAQALVEDVLRQHPTLEGVLVVLAWCLSARGEHEQARALLTDRVLATAAADHDIAFWLASFYAMEGMREEALDWVGRAVRLGNENYPLFAGSRKLDALRDDPRFVAVMEDLQRRWERRREAVRRAG
jgi:serine/threonine-protein kinase